MPIDDKIHNTYEYLKTLVKKESNTISDPELIQIYQSITEMKEPNFYEEMINFAVSKLTTFCNANSSFEMLGYNNTQLQVIHILLFTVGRGLKITEFSSNVLLNYLRYKDNLIDVLLQHISVCTFKPGEFNFWWILFENNLEQFEEAIALHRDHLDKKSVQQEFFRSSVLSLHSQVYLHLKLTYYQAKYAGIIGSPTQLKKALSDFVKTRDYFKQEKWENYQISSIFHQDLCNTFQAAPNIPTANQELSLALNLINEAILEIERFKKSNVNSTNLSSHSEFTDEQLRQKSKNLLEALKTSSGKCSNTLVKSVLEYTVVVLKNSNVLNHEYFFNNVKLLNYLVEHFKISNSFLSHIIHEKLDSFLIQPLKIAYKNKLTALPISSQSTPETIFQDPYLIVNDLEILSKKCIMDLKYFEKNSKEINEKFIDKHNLKNPVLFQKMVHTMLTQVDQDIRLLSTKNNITLPQTDALESSNVHIAMCCALLHGIWNFAVPEKLHFQLMVKSLALQISWLEQVFDHLKNLRFTSNLHKWMILNTNQLYTCNNLLETHSRALATYDNKESFDAQGSTLQLQQQIAFHFNYYQLHSKFSLLQGDFDSVRKIENDKLQRIDFFTNKLKKLIPGLTKRERKKWIEAISQPFKLENNTGSPESDEARELYQIVQPSILKVLIEIKKGSSSQFAANDWEATITQQLPELTKELDTITLANRKFLLTKTADVYCKIFRIQKDLQEYQLLKVAAISAKKWLEYFKKQPRMIFNSLMEETLKSCINTFEKFHTLREAAACDLIPKEENDVIKLLSGMNDLSLNETLTMPTQPDADPVQPVKTEEPLSLASTTNNDSVQKAEIEKHEIEERDSTITTQQLMIQELNAKLAIEQNGVITIAESYKKKLESLRAEINSEKKYNSDLNNTIADLHANILTKDIEIKKHFEELCYSKNQNASLTKQFKNKEKEVAAKNFENNNLKKNIVTRDEQIFHLETKTAQLQNELTRITEENQSNISQQRELEHTCNILKKKLQVAEKTNNNHKQSIENLKKQITSLQQTNANFLSQLNEKEEKFSKDNDQNNIIKKSTQEYTTAQSPCNPIAQSFLISLLNQEEFLYRANHPKIHLPKKLFNFLKHLEKDNHKAYLYGGYLRAHLTNTPYADYDIVTTRENNWIKKNLPQFTQNPHRPGQWHNTERKMDLYSCPNLSLLELAKDADFTINSVLCTTNGDLIDPTYQGIKDIYDGKFTILGDANSRLKKNACIILREVRLCLTLQWQLPTDHPHLMKTYIRYLDKIPLGIYLKNIYSLFYWHGACALDSLYSLGILGETFLLRDINYELNLQPKMYSFWISKLSETILDSGQVLGLLLILPLANRLLSNTFENALSEIVEEFLNHWTDPEDQATKLHLQHVLNRVMTDFYTQYQVFQVPNLINNFSQLNVNLPVNYATTPDYYNDETSEIPATFIPQFTQRTNSLKNSPSQSQSSNKVLFQQ